MEEAQHYSCDVRTFVAAVDCAFIDYDPRKNSDISGMVYDRTRSFPVHGNHPGPAFQPLGDIASLVELDAVAHNIIVYPFKIGEYVRRRRSRTTTTTPLPHPSPPRHHPRYFHSLARLAFLIASVPDDIPILLVRRGGGGGGSHP